MQQNSIEIEGDQADGVLRMPGLLSRGTSVQSRGQEFIPWVGEEPWEVLELEHVVDQMEGQ